MDANADLENLKGKLGALSGILRLGHDAFRKKDAEGVASHIVNNTKILFDYGRSALIDRRGVSAGVLAVNGQAAPKQDSECCSALRLLVSSLPPREGPVSLKASGENADLPEEAKEALASLCAGHPDEEILVVPLPDPGTPEREAGFVWVVEFFNGAPPQAVNILSLLAQHYAEALWFKAMKRPGVFDGLVRLKDLPPVKIAAIALVALALLLSCVRIRQYAVADFEIAPESESVCYSQLQGILKKASKANGETVKAGETILAFDVDELNFKLAAAVKDFEEISAELDATRQKSFSSPDLIAKTKLLEIKREQDRIEIDKTRWALSKAKLDAPIDGALVMEDKDKMEGKAVKPGDKLFEIIPSSSLLAEIFLSERDASVLGDDMSASLYLHTQPGATIRGKLVSVAPKPILTADRKYCYVLKFKPDDPKGLICGMRGVARLGGQRVSLGYHIFRSAVLWWRKI